jgi:hypothetical protein
VVFLCLDTSQARLCEVSGHKKAAAKPMVLNCLSAPKGMPEQSDGNPFKQKRPPKGSL